MKILIYGINYRPELTGIGKYTGELVDWLIEQDHQVRVITAQPYYPDWKIYEGYPNKFSKVINKNLEVIRCPLYIPKNLNALSRLIHLISFSLSSFVPVIKSFTWKPKIVIHVVPTLFGAIPVIILSKFLKIKSIIHIQDYEVDAMLGLSIIKLNFLKKPILWFEKKILNSYDIVSTISHGMSDLAKKKGIHSKKIIYFPNWSETKQFNNQEKNFYFIRNLGLDPDKKIILYAGNIGEKQGLEILIDVADKMKQNKDIQFVVVGEGSTKERLIKKSENAKLENISFLPLQEKQNLPLLLGSADCHLVIQRVGADDAFLPSKLTNIFAVGGNAIVSASQNSFLAKLVSDNKGIAILVKPECCSSIVKGIEEALIMPIPNTLAKKYAYHNFDKDIVLNRFMEDIINFKQQ